MSVDAYSPCPCGSGKKLKFCCHAIAADMERVERYQQGHQTRLALQALDAIDRKHPLNPWAVIVRAEILMQEGEADLATEALEPFVHLHPDHRYATGLMALAAFSADGYELAKPAIHRAFQRCARDFPALTANLAVGIAATMLSSTRYLSARAHLTLAFRIAADEDKPGIFRRLVDFDGNRRVPYPLRSVHELTEFSPPDDQRDEARKAFVLSGLGCWRPAAKVLLKLTEELPDNPALWYDLGLCRAWDGDEKLAAEALHKAAGLQSDRETAIEWETLAQLLDHTVTEDRVRMVTRRFEVSSISRLIGTLTDRERFIPFDFGGREDVGMPDALFQVLDRPPLPVQSIDTVTIDEIPRVIAQIALFDESELGGPRALVTGQEGDEFESALASFLEYAPELVTPVESENDEEDSAGSAPREFSMMLWHWHLPNGTPVGVRRRLEAEKWRRITLADWPDQPLAALGNKSPRQVAADPALVVPLRGAINVLDSYCDRVRYTLAEDELFRDLGIDPPPAVHFDRESSLTSLQLKRVTVRELDDQKLALLLQRAVLVRHSGFLYTVLREVLARPGCEERFEREQLLLTLSDLCREQRRKDEALQWVAQGLEIARADNAFEPTLNWLIQELTVRLDDPADPELDRLLRHISSYYFPKIPELQDEIEDLLAAAGVTPPWSAKSETAVPTRPGETLWTPDATAPQPAATARKLWLPGE